MASSNEFSFKPILIFCTLITILIICLVGLGPSMLPLFASFATAYFVFPAIKKMESYGIKREYAILGVFALSTLFYIILGIIFLPRLLNELMNFVRELPQMLERAIDKIEGLGFESRFLSSEDREKVQTFLAKYAPSLSESFLKNVTKQLQNILSNALEFTSMIFNLALTPLFFFYFVSDYEKIRFEIFSYIPPSILPSVKKMVGEFDKILNGYIRGQLLVALILAVLYGGGLGIIGLKFGFLIGIVSGLLNIIPYAGFAIGLLSALVMSLAYFETILTPIGVIVVFVVVQLLESFLITPKLVGNKVGLSSLSTLLALIIGGNLFGTFGILIAIPLAAMTKKIVYELKSSYNKV